MSVIVLEAGKGRLIPLGPIRMYVQEDGTHTRGTFGIAEFAVPPHAPTPPPHLHHAHAGAVPVEHFRRSRAEDFFGKHGGARAEIEDAHGIVSMKVDRKARHRHGDAKAPLSQQRSGGKRSPKMDGNETHCR